MGGSQLSMSGGTCAAARHVGNCGTDPPSDCPTRAPSRDSCRRLLLNNLHHVLHGCKLHHVCIRYVRVYNLQVLQKRREQFATLWPNQVANGARYINIFISLSTQREPNGSPSTGAPIPVLNLHSPNFTLRLYPHVYREG